MIQRWGSVVLAGGRGTRMGNVDKGGLLYRGRTFRDHMREELSALKQPLYLSTAAYDVQAWEAKEWNVIEDSVKGADGEWIGPMGGIWSSFQAADLDGIFVVSCDMPLFRKEMARILMERWNQGIDAVLWRTRDGRLQPMCAFYSRSCLEALGTCLEEKNYRMMEFLRRIRLVEAAASEEHIPDSWFMNVNSPEVYAGLQSMRPPVLAVSGRKDTGKTALLEMIVRELSKKGARAAVIKHDGHDFVADVPGTDSFRMKQAGAVGTVVYSDSRFSVVKEQQGMEAADFFSLFSKADILLLEGQKGSEYPKLEMMRREISLEPVCKPETVLAYVWAGENGWKTGEDMDAFAVGVGDAPGIRPCPVYTADEKDLILELVAVYMDSQSITV